MEGICSLCKQEQESRDHLCMLLFQNYMEKSSFSMGLNSEVLGWNGELVWAVKRLKGKALITNLLTVGWNAFISYMEKEK